MADVVVRIIGECIIEVGDRRIGPEAPHLFALMLYLASSDGHAITRLDLGELLFTRTASAANSAHNLRQLLYRLKQLGVPLGTQGERVSLSPAAITSPLAPIINAGRIARQSLRASDLAVLPGYEPSVTEPYADWLDSLRAGLAKEVRGILLRDLDMWRTEQKWASTERVARTLRALDVSNEQVIAALAEALALSGRASEALVELDAFLSDNERPATDAPVLRQLRNRIVRAKPQTAPQQGTFRGRADHIATLAATWREAAGGRARLSIITGAPGVGKSRLASELEAFAALNGSHAVCHRCDSTDHARPHSLFRQLLPQLQAMRGSLGASPKSKASLELLSVDHVAIPSRHAASAEATRNDIRLALVDMVEAVSDDKPLLLIVDDAHFLDSASWAVIRAICFESAGASVMVVCCCRGDAGERPILPPGDQVSYHVLTPLTPADSRALLTELLPAGVREEAHLEWCITQAAGNPYYLHALARHGHAGHPSEHMPFDIVRLASSLYFALDRHSRTLLESSLFLGRLATMRRVQLVSELGGEVLLSALRRLEADGLLFFSAGELQFPHALMTEALRTLVPTSIAAAAHQRVARCLESECTRQGHSAPLAWAAAESWIASGDLVASTALLRECALQAAAIGEYRVAARTLLRIPRASIGLTSLGGVAEEANAYAEVAGDRALLFTTLSNLLETKRELGAPRAEIQELEFRVVESSLQQGADPNPCVEPLLILLNDDGAAPALRVRAGIRLLTAADLLLDELLAQTTHECLCGIFELLQDQDILRRRAELVFATVFGNLDHAMDLVAALLDEHPEPKLEQATGLARQYAAFALSRIGARDLAGPVLRADYEYMARRHVHSEALYSLILLAENAIADGAMSEAADWLVRAERAVRSEEPGTNYYYSNAAYFSAAANLAIIEGRLEDAEALLGEARKRYPILSSPRLVAMQAALLVRLKLARGKPVDRDPDYLLLQESYRRGGHLGGQDLIVDTLWQAISSRGLHGEADALLAQYLRERRRERTRPEWLLFRSIAANRAAMRSVHRTSNSIPSVDTA